MDNDLNITDEEYREMNAVEPDDSIIINTKNIKRVR